MKLLELFERDKKAPLSPEETRLRTILSVMSNRMKKDKLPSMIKWDRLGRVLDKSGVPFSMDQVRSYIEKDFSDRLSMDDRGNIKIVSAADADAGLGADLAADNLGSTDDLGGMDDLGAATSADMGAGIAAGSPAPVAPEQPQEPVTDKNVTDQMAKRALKRRM